MSKFGRNIEQLGGKLKEVATPLSYEEMEQCGGAMYVVEEC